MYCAPVSEVSLLSGKKVVPVSPSSCAYCVARHIQNVANASKLYSTINFLIGIGIINSYKKTGDYVASRLSCVLVCFGFKIPRGSAPCRFNAGLID